MQDKHLRTHPAARALPYLRMTPYRTPMACIALPETDDAADLARLGEGVTRLTAGRYEVTRVLARGGMSVVFLAWDTAEGRPVAIKVLDPREGATLENRERFRREARIASELAHPHIVPCHGSAHQGQITLTILRYVPGESLEEKLAREGTLSVRAALAILLPIADALAHVHAQGVIHRDVKPANILLHADDAWPFLTDFGVATLKTSEASRSEVAKGFGTPAYMAPEQVLGQWDADARTDVYALGLVAYRMLAGRLPWVSETAMGLAVQRTVWAPTPLRQLNPDVSPALAAIIDRCLARDPARRWKSMAEVRRRLLKVRTRLQRDASPPSPLARLLGRLEARAHALAPRIASLLLL